MLNPTDFAFEGSIKVSLWATFMDNANLYRYLAYFGETYDGWGPRYVIAKSCSGHMAGRIYTQVIPDDVRVTSLADGEQIPKETWIHIVSVIDQETDTLSLYINDVFQSSEPIGDFSLVDVCQKVFLGRSIAPDAVVPDWHYGVIDDVAIYVPEPATLLLLSLGVLALRKIKCKV
ncbi:MAG: PEP-CTERM sorting domain-containing protein [Sedimentisphaerales bacterium]|nr:PEP-CTERM sorting domain-containing protein [Sedimentisphaerales bacterium]